jgi:hypothetical protein
MIERHSGGAIPNKGTSAMRNTLIAFLLCTAEVGFAQTLHDHRPRHRREIVRRILVSGFRSCTRHRHDSKAGGRGLL